MVTVFEQGDIVYLDFDPQSGHEQKGRRPALVVSNNLFNRVSSLTMVCPITHTDGGTRFIFAWMSGRGLTALLCATRPGCWICPAGGQHLRKKLPPILWRKPLISSSDLWR